MGIPHVDGDVFAEGWNAETAAVTEKASPESVTELVAACKALLPWIAKGIVEGAYKGCVCPNGAKEALDRAANAITKIMGERL